ncbi:MAG: molybdopterin synthase sulfur carrier subunit [Planctomycetota bacterium]|nr:MAG: molybdopterin synthase sulfur carrier subunit [Planctomycetota bacterium]
MKVAVKLFAAARELAGAGEIAVEAPLHATVGELRRALVEQSPRLGPLADRSLMAVNAQYADNATVVSPSDEVALIPPVSGG